MTVAMNVNISGTVLASLFYEHANSDSDLDGFLLGKVGSQLTDMISDSQIRNTKEETTCYIYSFVSCKKPLTWYGGGGKICIPGLKKVLSGNKQRDVIGWFKFRRNSTMRASLREQSIHCHLLDCFPGILPKNFLFLLCTPQQSTNKSTHDMDHVFQIHNGKTFQGLQVNMVNLGDTVNSEYRTQGSNTVSVADGRLSTIFGQLRPEFLASDGQMHSVVSVQTLNMSLSGQLQDMCNSVSKSEQELKSLREGIRLLKARLKPKPTLKPQTPPPSDLSDRSHDTNPFRSSFTEVADEVSANPFSPSFRFHAESNQMDASQFSVIGDYPQDKNPFASAPSKTDVPEMDLISLEEEPHVRTKRRIFVEEDGKTKSTSGSGARQAAEQNNLPDSDDSNKSDSLLDFSQPLVPDVPQPVLSPQQSDEADNDRNSRQEKPAARRDAFDFVHDLMSTQRPAMKNSHSAGFPSQTDSATVGRSRSFQSTLRDQPLRAASAQSNNNTYSGYKARGRSGVAEAIEVSSSDDEQTMDYNHSLSGSQVF